MLLPLQLLCYLLVVFISYSDNCDATMISSDPPYDQKTMAAIVLVNKPVTVTCSAIYKSGRELTFIEGSHPVSLTHQVGYYAARGITWSNITHSGEFVILNITVVPSSVQNRTNITCVYNETSNTIKIVPVKGIPFPPKGLQAVIESPHSLRVTWEPPWPHPVNSYTLFINNTPSTSAPYTTNINANMFVLNVTLSNVSTGDCNLFEFSVQAHTSVGSTSWSNVSAVWIPIDISDIDDGFLISKSEIHENLPGMFSIEMEPLPTCGAETFQYQFNITSPYTSILSPSIVDPHPMPMFMFSVEDLILNDSTCVVSNNGSYDRNSFNVQVCIIVLNKEMEFNQSNNVELYPNISFQCVNKPLGDITHPVTLSSRSSTDSYLEQTAHTPYPSSISYHGDTPILIIISPNPDGAQNIKDHIPLLNVSVAVAGVLVVAMVTIATMVLVFVINRNKKKKSLKIQHNTVNDNHYPLPPILPEQMTLNEQYLLEDPRNHLYEEIPVKPFNHGHMSIPVPVPIPPAPDSIFKIKGGVTVSSDIMSTDNCHGDGTQLSGSEDYVEMH